MKYWKKSKKIDPSIRVIMLTTYPTEETKLKSIMMGASEYCIKLIDTEELEEKVIHVLKAG